MSHFIRELRAAHSVFTSFKGGDLSVPRIAARTHLSVTEVAQWVRLLRLPVIPATPSLGPVPYQLEELGNLVGRS